MTLPLASARQLPRVLAFIAALSLAGPAPTCAAEPTTAPRASLLPLARPLWSELAPAQQQILSELEPQWNGMPAARKRTWLTLAERIPRMEGAERERAEARIREWARLTPEQRNLARNNYRLAKTLPKDTRAATWEQYRQMTPEQREVLRSSGSTSNTAARHAGAATGLAKQAARPLPGVTPRPPAQTETPPLPSAAPAASPSTTPSPADGESPVTETKE